MDDDLKKGLLSKKGGNFDKLYEECIVRIQRIKQKNDFMQKQIGTEIEDEMRNEVQKQKQYIEKEIKQIKDYMNEIEVKYKDPQSKNRLKQLKTDAQKQIQRNKIILKDLIIKSFARRSQSNRFDEDNERFMEEGNIDYAHLNSKNNHEDMKKQSVLTDQQIEVDIDYDLEKKMLREKNEMINEVEQSTQRINEIMNDMGLMVDEQGQNLEVISEELLKTNKNLVATNQNLQQAATLQKKSRKKYVVFVVIILIVIAIVGGLIYILAK